MAFVYPGVDERTQYIVQQAIARGMDPTQAVQVAHSEGLQPGTWQSNVFKNGVQEPSYGDFQLYTGGGLGNKFQKATGLNPADPQNWQQGVNFALDTAKTHGWGDWYGARKQGIVGMPAPYDPNNPYNPTAQPSLVAQTPPPGGGILDPQQMMAAMVPQPAPPPQTGLMNFIQSPGALGLASGLLMASGPSPVRTGLGSALGQGFQEMSKAQQLASANEIKREQLASQAISDQQTRVMNMATLQQLFANQAQKAKEDSQAQAALKNSMESAYSAASGGYDAAKELNDLEVGGAKIGESIATLDPDTIHLARQGIAAAKAAGPGNNKAWLTSLGGLFATPALAGIGLDVSTPDGLKEADHVITLAETLNKQRANLAQQLSAMANQGNRSATALLNRLQGTGAEAGLAVNMDMFGNMRDLITQQATESGFNVGDPRKSTVAPGTPDLTTVPPPTASQPAPAPQPVVPPSGPQPAPPVAGGQPVQAGSTMRPPVAVPRVGTPKFADETQARNWLSRQPDGTYTVQIGNMMTQVTVKH